MPKDSNNKKLKKVCLLGATFGTNNLGVNVLTAGTIKSILTRHPKAELVLLDYGKNPITYEFPYKGSNIPIKLINMRFSKKFYLRNNIIVLLLIALIARFIPSKFFQKKLIQQNYYLRHICESDIAAAISGGDSFSDIYGLKRFLYVSLPQVLVLVLGQKLVLLPQTIGPFSGKFSKHLAHYILKNSYKIYSRDFIGISEIKQLPKADAISHKLDFCYDVGFIVDPIEPKNRDWINIIKQGSKEDCLIGLNVSGLLYMGGYSKNNMFGLKFEYTEFIRDLIGHLLVPENTTVLLVPHVYGSDPNGESDYFACKKVYSKLKNQYSKRLILAEGYFNHHEIKHVIGLCNFMIGSRMHACIAALSQNIPAVGIAYSKKFLGVFDTIGMKSLVADPRMLDKRDIFAIIDSALIQREKLGSELKQKSIDVKEKILSLFENL